jgi:hypothetical protein
MKPSKRNIARMEAQAAKRAQGKPLLSAYEQKHRTPEQLEAAARALSRQGQGVVKAG